MSKIFVNVSSSVGLIIELVKECSVTVSVYSATALTCVVPLCSTLRIELDTGVNPPSLVCHSQFALPSMNNPLLPARPSSAHTWITSIVLASVCMAHTTLDDHHTTGVARHTAGVARHTTGGERHATEDQHTTGVELTTGA